MQKDVSFNWTEQCENSFTFLKNCLVSEPVLAHPNYNKNFYLFCDASNTGVGAALLQSENGSEKRLRPIGYFSKSLNNTQKKYSTTKKEFLAIHLALKEFQYLCLGYPITILTDHKPLVSFFSKKLPLDQAMARWAIEASVFDCQVKYFEGRRNIVADTLSRLDEETINKCDIIVDSNNAFDSIDSFMVTTRAQTKVNYPNLDSDSESEDEVRDVKPNKEKPFLNYVPNFEDVTWSLKELKELQKTDHFCQEIVDCINNLSLIHI